MNKFDKDEQLIYSAMSSIKVESKGIKENIISRLDEPIDERVYRKKSHKLIILVACLAVLLIGTAAAAVSLGVFDWFIEKFNPTYGMLTERVEQWSEDQGIRMEVIGAQKYANFAVVYLSLQDITGQNRITENTAFMDGFSVLVERYNEEIEEMEVVGSSFSLSDKVLEFDKDTNTIYYELKINGSSDLLSSSTLTVSSFLIYFDVEKYEDEPLGIDMTSLRNPETISASESRILYDDLDDIDKVLKPSNFADMPTGAKDQSISNAGIIDDKFHIQIKTEFNKEFGSSTPNIRLKSSSGKVVEPYQESRLYIDKNNEIVSDFSENSDKVAYSGSEYIFDIDTSKLSDYTPVFTTRVYTGVEGKWKVSAELSEDGDRVKSFYYGKEINGIIYEEITITPLGVGVTGECLDENYDMLNSPMHIYLELKNGEILEASGGIELRYNDDRTIPMSGTWDTKKPIDESQVVAVIIEETKIEVK